MRTAIIVIIMELSSGNVVDNGRFMKFVGYVHITHGGEVPRWYLPVSPAPDRHGWKCYPIPIALVLLPCRMLQLTFTNIWYSCIYWVDIMELWNARSHRRR
jgi:hypothetical protein